ncbi:MAG: hypothetical protein ABN479_07975 [Billgrantia sp.]
MPSAATNCCKPDCPPSTVSPNWPFPLGLDAEARFIANAFGGSHAQRDIIDWTLTEAALRGGYRDLAEGLAHERLAAKPHSPVNRAFLNRASALGDRPRQVA